MGFFIDKHHRRKSSMAVTAFFAALIDLFVFGILYGVLSEPLYRLVRLGSEASSTVVQGILIALLGTALCCLQFLLRDKRIAPYGFAGLAVALALGYRIHVERNAPGFSGDFQQVVHDAAEHVKAAVDKVVKDGKN